MGHSNPADPAALKRFGQTLMHLAGIGQSDQALGTALTLAGAQALAIGLGVTPHGQAAAYRAAQRYAAKVNRDCASAGH